MGKRKPSYRNGDCTLGRRGAEACVCYPDESTGKRKRVRLGIAYKDTEAAKAEVDAFAERRRIIKQQQASHTIGDLWQQWMDEREADKLRNDIYLANWASLKPVFANRYPDTITTQDCRDYAKGRFALGRAPSTVHTELIRLRQCVDWAAKHHLIAKTPVIWVPQPSPARDLTLSIEDAKRLVEGAHKGDPHIYLFVVLAFATGARHMAILDLTWDRVDFSAGTIQYDEDLPPDPMSKAWRKGRATVPMNTTARAALETAYEGRQTDYVIEHGGRRLKSVREGFANAVERAKISEDVTPHTIRHTVSTWLDAKAVDDKRRAQLLGHTNPIITNKVYTHAKPDLLSEAVSLLDAEFAPLPKIDHSEAESEGSRGAETVEDVPLGQLEAAE